MGKFAENLVSLASVEHIARLDLLDRQGAVVASIENKPGSQGSLKVYSHLADKWGCIDTAAAAEGLALYGEHSEDALENPGKHPNIDRLYEIVSSGAAYAVKLTPLETA